MRNYINISNFIINYLSEKQATLKDLSTTKVYYLLLKNNMYFEVISTVANSSMLGLNRKKHGKFIKLDKSYELYWDEVCYYS